VRYINHTYGRSGTLWEGRYKASLVDSEAYLLICMRYIELNPVRAAMVEHPGAYRWSSYGHNAYGRSDRLISAHPLYTALGVDAPRQQEAYRELFRQHIDATLTHEIQEAVSHELVLGRDRFKERIEQMTKRQTSPRKMGRPPTLGVAEPSADYYVM
jgi:putative transposase